MSFFRKRGAQDKLIPTLHAKISIEVSAPIETILPRRQEKPTTEWKAIAEIMHLIHEGSREERDRQIRSDLYRHRPFAAESKRHEAQEIIHIHQPARNRRRQEEHDRLREIIVQDMEGGKA